MTEIDHPVSTHNSEAQKKFNRGLTYIFAFNHDLAYTEFNAAAQLDPNLAMAYWGMALALGQNVNQDVTKENEIRAYNLIQKAIQLAPSASKSEQDYIDALSTRYTNDPNANLIPFRSFYMKAMKKVREKYSEDLDAAALYAESLLDLTPWKWWTNDGKPLPGTLEAIETLEFVLARNPYHIGANHYYIHAIEESPFPERAWLSAIRLTTLFPESGHLLHMPNHIFILVGDYESAIKTSQNAIQADLDYIQSKGNRGHYPTHYLSHNMAVFARTYMLMDDYDHAIQTALELVKFTKPFFNQIPGLSQHCISVFEVYLYFHKWKEILDFQAPTDDPVVKAYQHFSRAMAYAHLHLKEKGEVEKTLFRESLKRIPLDSETALNPTLKIMDLAETLLKAKFAQLNREPYLNYLQEAVIKQDQLDYNEPPAWYMPTRQLLGAALLKEKKYKEAEDHFKKALQKLQRNGRLLYGLELSLQGQGRVVDAFWVAREKADALKNSTQPLTLEDLD